MHPSRENQQGSYVQPVVPPSSDPTAAPLYCVSFNREWYPYITGALFQLMQPSSWVGTDAEKDTAVKLAAALLARIGQAGDCPVLAADCGAPGGKPRLSIDGGLTWLVLPDCFIGPPGANGTNGTNGTNGVTPQLRWNGCSFQASADGGATWSNLSGFTLDVLQACLTGSPGNPQGVPTAQGACNIASWLAVVVLQGALSNVATSIAGGATLLEAVKSIGGLAFGLVELLDPFVLAAAALFGAAVVVGATALNAAAADATLKADLICAIYSAISADGKITAANYAALLANVTAISYGTPAIVGMLANFIGGLGFTGLNALQAQGTLYAGDCSGCSSPPGEPALYFVSTVNNAVALASDLPTSGSFTIGGWFFPVSLGPGTECFVICGNDGTHSNQFQLYEDATHHLSLYADNGVGSNLDLHSTALVTGGAHHIAVSRSGSTATLWLDGVSVATGALPSGSFSHAGGGSAFGGNGAIVQKLGGQLWRWAYYASAFSAAQMAAWFGGGRFAAVPAGAAHSWLFGEGSGTTVADDVGGAGGTLGSMASTWVTHS